MLSTKKLLLAAAATAALPTLGHAAVITFSYDNFQYSTTATFTAATTTTVALANGGATAQSVSVPSSATFFRYTIDVLVTGNPNAASGGAFDTANGQTQPANLGLGAYGEVITDSAPAVAVPRVVSGVSTATTNGIFDVFSKGAADTTTGTVGSIANPLSGGVLSTNVDTSDTTNTGAIAKLTLGSSTAGRQSVANNVAYSISSTGSLTLNAVIPPGTLTKVVLASAGDAGTTPTYTSTFTGAGDTVNNLPALTVVVGAATPTATPLISLTTAAPGTGFGTSLGNLAVTGANGSYRTATVNFNGTNAGFVGVSGFTPATDTEVYGLQVIDSNPNTLTTDLAALVAAINATGGTTDNNGGTITAALRTPANSGGLPTADNIVLTTAGTTGGNPFLGFNFSTVANAAGVLTVGSISAVPEPTMLGMAALGTVTLLGSRRRSRKVA